MSYLETVVIESGRDADVWNGRHYDGLVLVDLSGDLPDNEHIIISRFKEITVVYEDGTKITYNTIRYGDFWPADVRNDNIMREFLLNKEIDLWITYSKLHDLGIKGEDD